jgi:hypothetical protein
VIIKILQNVFKFTYVFLICNMFQPHMAIIRQTFNSWGDRCTVYLASMLPGTSSFLLLLLLCVNFAQSTVMVHNKVVHFYLLQYSFIYSCLETIWKLSTANTETYDSFKPISLLFHSDIILLSQNSMWSVSMRLSDQNCI